MEIDIFSNNLITTLTLREWEPMTRRLDGIFVCIWSMLVCVCVIACQSQVCVSVFFFLWRTDKILLWIVNLNKWQNPRGWMATRKRTEMAAQYSEQQEKLKLILCCSQLYFICEQKREGARHYSETANDFATFAQKFPHRKIDSPRHYRHETSHLIAVVLLRWRKDSLCFVVAATTNWTRVGKW